MKFECHFSCQIVMLMNDILSFLKSQCQEQMKPVEGPRMKTELSWSPPMSTHAVYSVGALPKTSQMDPFYNFHVPLLDLVCFCDY